MTQNIDNRGANIEIQTIIERQFGQLTIGTNASVPSDKAQEMRDKIDGIRSELSDLKDVDPAFASALLEVNQALTALDGGSLKPVTITDRLKSAAEALGHVEKAGSSAKTIVGMLASVATWIARVLL